MVRQRCYRRARYDSSSSSVVLWLLVLTGEGG